MGYKVATQPLSSLFCGNRVWVRREDLYPVAFGGNKARKAEDFIADAKRNRTDICVTYGSSASNHARAVACLACQSGMDTVIISPSEQSESTYNRTLSELFGATVTECPMNQVSVTIDRVLEDLKKEGRRPYFIEGGGHGNIGTGACKKIFDEISLYEAEAGIKFDMIFHASGTGTTQAGLICGKLLSGSDVRIVGISIARPLPRGRNVVIDSVRSFLNDAFSEEVIESATCFDTRWISGGYGEHTAAQDALMAEMLRREGLPLDFTYTGKAFFGMTEYLREERISGRNVLFIHTGGTPLFYNDVEKFR